MVKKMFKFLIAFAMVVQLVPSSYVNINAIASNEVQPSEYAELITSNEPDERVALGATNSEGSAKLNVTTLLDGATVQEETLIYNGDNQPGVATATASAGYTIASITLDGINYAGSSILFDRELGILEKSLVINVTKIVEPVQEPEAVVEEPVVEETTDPVDEQTTPVEDEEKQEPVKDQTTEDPVEEINNDLQNTTPNVKQATPTNKWLRHKVTIYSYIANETHPFDIEDEDVSLNSMVKIKDLDIEENVTVNKQTYVIDYITYNDMVVEDQFYIGWTIGDVKVYYTEKPTTTEYTITFNANGGKFVHGDTTKEVTTKNGRAYLLEEPTRNGYEFVGWYTKKGFGSQWGEKVTDTRNFTEDTLVHARWEKKESQIQDKRVQFYILKQGEEKPVGTMPDDTYKYLPLGSGVLAEDVKDVYGEEEVNKMILSKPANRTLAANSYCKVNTTCKELVADEYEIVWYRIIYDASDGWHVDGYIKETAKVNIIYNLVQPGEDNYSFFGSKSIDVGSSIDAWPTNTPEERIENGITYKFSGWYTDDKRTKKADVNTIYGEEYRNQAVQLYAAYETTTRVTLDVEDGNYVYDGTAKGLENVKASVKGSTILYSKDEGKTWEEEAPTFTNNGTYSVQVKATHANYVDSESVGAHVNITARPITITVDSANKTYDGTPLLNPKTITSEVMSEGKGLVDGQVVNATVTGPESITDVGKVELGLDENLTITVDGDTKDLSGNYAITVVPGNLEITKAEAANNKLTVGNKTLVYNGFAQAAMTATAKVGTVEYSLDGQIWTTDVPTCTDVGKITINVRVVSENYKTDEATETLEITTRPITVTSGNATKVYDGTALTSPGLTIDQQSDENPDGGLVSGQTFIGKATGSITSVEDSKDKNNAIGTIAIMDGTSPVTDNYALTQTTGTLTITARPVTITVDSASKSYDGQPLLNPGSVTAEAMSEGKGLVEGQVINATVTGPESRTNVGSDDLGLDENNLTITVDGNTEDLSGNYDITVVQGILEVTKAGAAENAVTVKDVSVVFDRNTHTAYVPTDAKEGSTIYYSSDEEDWTKEVPEFFDAGTTTVYIKVVNDNYADFTTNEKVEITKRPVTITANSGNKMYDGTPLTNNGYTVEKANEDNPNIGLLEYDELSVTVKGSQTIPGESANEITDYAITNDGESMNANYDVTTISGTLTVTLAELGLEPMDNVNEIYDGTGKTIGNVVASEEGSTIWYSTSKGRDAWTTEKPTFTEAGDHEVYVKATKEHYYDAMFDNPVIVTIIPKEITITALDARQEFNGSPLTSAAYSISENGLVEGQSIREILFDGTQTVVGESSNSILKVSISDGNEDKSMNYKMTFVDGRLIVTDAPVPVTPVAPATPDTPTPPVGPVVPTTITPTTITPTPTAPLPVLTPTLPQENVTENETPLAIPEEEEKVEIKENVTPKAVMGSWALFNLLFAAGSLILGVWLLVSRLHKEEEDEENEDDEDNSIPYKRKKWLRVATTITAIVSVLVFCLTEDMTLKMLFFDKWTLLMAVFFIAQFAFFYFGKKWQEEENNEEENDSVNA